MFFGKKNNAGEPAASAQTQAEAEQAAAYAPSEEVEEVREVRHTISSEETFTLAKDVYDLRCAIKKIYLNRAQIARRLNILSLAFSLVFTAIYVATNTVSPYKVYGIVTAAPSTLQPVNT